MARDKGAGDVGEGLYPGGSSRNQKPSAFTAHTCLGLAGGGCRKHRSELEVQEEGCQWDEEVEAFHLALAAWTGLTTRFP